jgi:dTDP-4-amino-4,6-dideoxygalactose transaminase
MVASRNKELLERVRDLRQYDKKEDYKVRYNFCMTDLLARMGRIQLEKLPSFLKTREKRAQWYDKHLQGLNGVIVPRKRGIYYRYIVRIKDGKLDRVIGELHRRGIEAQRPVFRPLHRYLGLAGFATTEQVFAEALSLPIYPRIKADEVRNIALCLRRAVEDTNA